MVNIKEFRAYSLSDIENNIGKVKEYLKDNLVEEIHKLIVEKTDKPAIYLYRIDYEHPATGNSESVYGFVSLMQVDKQGQEKQVFGHERVFPEQAENLYDCFKFCDVQFNPIVVIYKDYSKINDELLVKSEKMEPIIDAEIDIPKARHRVWAFHDEDLIKNLKAEMEARRVIVADGHHRYRAAEIMGDKDNTPWIMTMFIDAHNPGLLLLPWHRVLKEFDMDKFLTRLYDPIYGFKVYETKTKKDMLAALELAEKEAIEAREITGRPPKQKKGSWQCLSKDVVYFGLQFENGDVYYLITIDDVKLTQMASKMGEKICLELTLLHIWLVNRVIPKATPVEYLSSVEEVEEAIKNGYKLAVYIPAMKKEEIILKAVWEKKPVPERATCFRPKAKTGVLFWKIPKSKASKAKKD